MKYLVCYDASKNHDEIDEILEEMRAKRIQESTWILHNPKESPHQIRRKIQALLDRDDTILIIAADTSVGNYSSLNLPPGWRSPKPII